MAINHLLDLARRVGREAPPPVHFAPSRAPSRAVLATGELLADGRVLQVGQLDTKYAIARQEGGAVIILSRGSGSRPGALEAGTLAEAARITFGDALLHLDLDVTHSALDAIIHRARTQAATAEGIELALAQGDLGDHDAAEATTREATERLSLLHPEATRFHARLLSPIAAEREAELDRVWYRVEVTSTARVNMRFHPRKDGPSHGRHHGPMTDPRTDPRRLLARPPSRLLHGFSRLFTESPSRITSGSESVVSDGGSSPRRASESGSVDFFLPGP